MAALHESPGDLSIGGVRSYYLLRPWSTGRMILNLDIDIARACPEFDPAYVRVMRNCAALSLSACGHRPGVRLDVEGSWDVWLEMWWTPALEGIRESYDRDMETEHGAYGAALGVLLKSGRVASQRSAKGTGFDFWLRHESVARETYDSRLFQGTLRLEVSGTRGSYAGDRLRRKIEQVNRVPSALPGCVVIVDFVKPKVLLKWIT
jgi:hypothetical protein